MNVFFPHWFVVLSIICLYKCHISALLCLIIAVITEHFYLFIQSHTSLDLLALTPSTDQKMWQISKHLCICFCFSLLVLNRSTQLTYALCAKSVDFMLILLG